MSLNVTPVRDLPLDNIASLNGNLYTLNVRYVGSVTLANGSQWSFFTDSTLPKQQTEIDDRIKTLLNNNSLSKQVIKVKTWTDQFPDSSIQNWCWVTITVRLTEYGLICVDRHIRLLNDLSIIHWLDQLKLEVEPQYDFLNKLAYLQYNNINLDLNCCYFVKVQIHDILILHNSYIFKKIQNSNLCIKDLELVVIDKFNYRLNLTINNNLLDFLDINYNNKKWKSSIELDSEILKSIKKLKKTTFWDDVNVKTYQMLVQLNKVSGGVYKWVYKCGC